MRRGRGYPGHTQKGYQTQKSRGKSKVLAIFDFFHYIAKYKIVNNSGMDEAKRLKFFVWSITTKRQLRAKFEQNWNNFKTSSYWPGSSRGQNRNSLQKIPILHQFLNTFIQRMPLACILASLFTGSNHYKSQTKLQQCTECTMFTKILNFWTVLFNICPCISVSLFRGSTLCLLSLFANTMSPRAVYIWSW